jgi:hypothetical protein
MIVLGAIIVAIIVISSLNKSTPQATTSSTGQPAASGAPSAAASAAPSAASSVKAVGQAMKNDAGQTVTVSSFKLNVPVTNQFEQPATGNQCVSVNMALFNGDSSPWSLPLFEMAIVDANGQSHSQAIATCGGGATSIDSLIPNGRANTSLLFEVPTSGALEFTWTPSALNPNSNYQTALK